MNLFIHLIIGTIIFLGGYQPYFWCQRRTLENSIVFSDKWSFFDKKIPLSPSWIWFYTIFYYPIIVLVVSLSSHNHSEFTLISFSYMIMLAAMCLVYLCFPVITPSNWREPVTGNTLSEKMLRLVRSIDGPNNCFPSGHAAVTVITAYHLAGLTCPEIAFVWALSIHISCLVCKQHYLIDLVAGAGLGAFVVLIYKYFLVPL